MHTLCYDKLVSENKSSTNILIKIQIRIKCDSKIENIVKVTAHLKSSAVHTSIMSFQVRNTFSVVN